MGTELAAWLSQQVRDKGWSLRQTARRAGLSHSTVARLANGEIGWTPETCTALAKVFDVPLEDVFRFANILPPAPAPRIRSRRIVYETDDGESILALWRGLDAEDQELVRGLLERLAQVAPKIVE